MNRIRQLGIETENVLGRLGFNELPAQHDHLHHVVCSKDIVICVKTFWILSNFIRWMGKEEVHLFIKRKSIRFKHFCYLLKMEVPNLKIKDQCFRDNSWGLMVKTFQWCSSFSCSKYHVLFFDGWCHYFTFYDLICSSFHRNLLPPF